MEVFLVGLPLLFFSHGHCLAMNISTACNVSQVQGNVSNVSQVEENVTVVYSIRNQLAKPFFEFSRNVTVQKGQPFIRFMEAAADADSRFRFSATYYGSLGFFIEEINKLRGYTGVTHWKVVIAPDNALQVGVSSMIPEDGDRIIFDYVHSEPVRCPDMYTSIPTTDVTNAAWVLCKPVVLVIFSFLMTQFMISFASLLEPLYRRADCSTFK